MTETVPVRVGDCRCPGTPHTNGDYVRLSAKLSARAGAAAMQAWKDAPPVMADMMGMLADVYLNHCIVSWDFLRETTDDKGKQQFVAVPIDRDTIEEFLPWAEGGQEVAQRADELYSADLLVPLARRTSRSSPDGLTGPSTSPTPRSGQKRRKQPKRSLQNGSAGSPFEVPAP